MRKQRLLSQALSRSVVIAALALVGHLSATEQGEEMDSFGGTLIIGLKGDFDSFNEMNAVDSDAQQVIKNMLFMTLARLDDNLQPVPHLASSWMFSNQDSTLTFDLRKDVRWTDGRPVLADDVLFTYELATNPKVAYPARSRFDFVQEVEIENRHRVRFHFTKPYPDALFDAQIPILPKHILETSAPEQIATSSFNREPVGNGPFKLVEWKANRQVIFEANEEFALGRPYLDRVIFSIIPDETVLLTNLLTNRIDMVPHITPTGFKQVRKNTELRALQYAGREFSFIGWNLRRSLFNLPVRRALTHAIDKREIILTLLEGFALPAKGPLLPFSWAYDEDLPDVPFDPEAAVEILAGEGWVDSDGDGVLDKGGQRLEFSIKTNVGSQVRKDVAVMVQAQLRRIGIKVNIELLEWNLFIDNVFVSKDFDAAVLAWEVDFTVDPKPLWHTDAIASGYNFVSFSNPRVDWLLERGRGTPRMQLAKPYWAEFQEIILQQCPYTFLFIPDRLIAFNRSVTGIKADARGFLSGIDRWAIRRNADAAVK